MEAQFLLWDSLPATEENVQIISDHSTVVFLIGQCGSPWELTLSLSQFKTCVLFQWRGESDMQATDRGGRSKDAGKVRVARHSWAGPRGEAGFRLSKTKWIEYNDRLDLEG